jgi:YYY domain-containing protein
MIDILTAVLRWWLVLLLLGAIGLPFSRRLLGILPDGGLAFARPLGLLAAGLLYWLGAMAGILPNNLLGAVLVVLILAGAGFWLLRQEGLDLRAWWGQHGRLLLGYELLFGATFLLWALFRAYNPNIETSGGEKYMEMAFLSAILDSPGFPPRDPWFAGGSISYYYFGYVIAALITRLSMLSRFVAFNLIVPTTLAMTLVAATGLGWNLAALSGAVRGRARWIAGLFTALIAALMGSLEGFLELAYIRAWLPARFFDWIAIKNLGVATTVCGEAGSGYGAGGWVPGRFIWWWRGSRVITDIDPISGGCREVIHEFPFFSFMLSDAHPHLMTLPYALLVLALALAVLAGGFDPERERSLWSPRYLALPAIVGALGFLNTWDLPTYGFVVVAAWALRAQLRPAASIGFEDLRGNGLLLLLGLAGLSGLAWRATGAWFELRQGLPPEAQSAPQRGLLVAILLALAIAAIWQLWTRAREGQSGAAGLLDAARFATWLGGLSIALYLPFYLGFSSQASGIGISDVRTRLPQWLVHFGSLFWLACSLVLLAAARIRKRLTRISLPSMIILGLAGGLGLYALLAQAWTALVLALVAGLAASLALEGWLAAVGDPERELPVAETFALLCVALGLLLPLATEFVFLRDLFGSRMNSIFKFYYQAWLLLAVGGGYALWALWRRLPRPAARLWTIPTALLVLAGLVFTVNATWSRSNGFQAPEGLSLDGLRWWRGGNAGDLEAAAWLAENSPRDSVILEASTPGGYAHNGRISLASGRPTVLGWLGHEHQWRGNAARAELDARQADVESAYGRANAAELETILRRYSVGYVVVGNLERGMGYYSPASEDAMRQVLTPAFTSSDGQTTIYSLRQAGP